LWGAIASLYLLSMGRHAAAQQDAGTGNEPRGLTAVRAEIRRLVDAKEIAGAVTMVATADRVLHLDATGQADLASERPMRPDTFFWIASMTKPITATAVMMLQDEGKLAVEDPVEKYLPEFGQLRTSDRKPARLTIRHLLTHTSGLGEASNEQSRGTATLAAMIPLYIEKPLKFEPGSKWEYCQSGINTAARVVEVLSNEPFDQFLTRRLFEPLGMSDTTFYPSTAQVARLAKSYRRSAEGELKETESPFLNSNGSTGHRRFPAANGGLFSTAPDYLRFCQMILRKGEYQGRHYVKPTSVERMTSIQTNGLKTGFTPGNGWGLGWCVIREPQGVTAALSPGSFGHGGAFGTQAWIDPEKGRIYLLMIQRANFPNSDASEVRRVFQDAATKGLAN
jgi:CubicO group peptidase (beta-lactamase class C family)